MEVLYSSTNMSTCFTQWWTVWMCLFARNNEATPRKTTHPPGPSVIPMTDETNTRSGVHWTGESLQDFPFEMLVFGPQGTLNTTIICWCNRLANCKCLFMCAFLIVLRAIQFYDCHKRYRKWSYNKVWCNITYHLIRNQNYRIFADLSEFFLSETEYL